MYCHVTYHVMGPPPSAPRYCHVIRDHAAQVLFQVPRLTRGRGGGYTTNCIMLCSFLACIMLFPFLHGPHHMYWPRCCFYESGISSRGPSPLTYKLHKQGLGQSSFSWVYYYLLPWCALHFLLWGKGHNVLLFFSSFKHFLNCSRQQTELEEGCAVSNFCISGCEIPPTNTGQR